VPVVRQRVTASVSEHVGMGLEAKSSFSACSLNHAGKASGREGCDPLRSKYEGRLGLLFTLEAAQGAQLVAEDRVGAGRTALNPADVQRARCELDLIPAEVNKLRRAQAVSVSYQDHGGITMAPAVLPGG